MKNQKIMFNRFCSHLPALPYYRQHWQGRYRRPPCTPTATPRLGEDRGNNNSAAENVDALNISTTGQQNTAHGWHALSANTTGTR